MRRSTATLSGFAVGGLLLIVGCDASPRPAPADLLITGARVYTFDWGDPARDGTPAFDAPHDDDGWHPDAEAVAVRGERIVFVGSDLDAEGFRGPETRVIDVGGATVLPGLVDSHVHVAGLGEAAFRVNLTDVETEEEAVTRVVAHAAGVPPGEWIVGRGWDEGAWANRYPTLELLSERVPDHPVVLDSLHGFAVWVNRRALARAGIDRETPDPDGGRIVRDAAGNPNGILLNRARSLIDRTVPPPTDEQFKSFMRAGLEQMARDGYVAVHEAGASSRHMRALEALAAEGALPIRVYAMLSARDAQLCRAWLERGPDTEHDRMLTTRAVKAYYDGALGSRGARLLEDYADRPGHRGVAGEGYGFDEQLVAEMMRAGFQVGIHAIGDAGNRKTLDFIESVIADQPQLRSGRHRIEHAQVVHPDDLPRFGELALIASMEPPHAVEDMVWAEDRLGSERVRGAYAWRTLRLHGARLIFNSDLTGSDHRIGYGLHSAVTRRNKQLEPAAGWNPAERMTGEEAVRAYTVWPAYAAGWESETGVLAPGRWADITVIDLDPLVSSTTEPARLLETRVRLTVVGGQVIYESEARPPGE